MTTHYVMLRPSGNEIEAVPDPVEMWRDDSLIFLSEGQEEIQCKIVFHKSAFARKEYDFKGPKLELGIPRAKSEMPAGDYHYDLTEVKIVRAKEARAAGGIDPTNKIKDPPDPNDP